MNALQLMSYVEGQKRGYKLGVAEATEEAERALLRKLRRQAKKLSGHAVLIDGKVLDVIPTVAVLALLEAKGKRG